MMDSAEVRLQQLNLTLPSGAPAGLYQEALRDGDLVYLSGKGPRRADGSLSTGKVGAEVSVAEAAADARLAMLALLGALRREVGSLDRVEQVLRVLGMVNATPGFADHPKVIDGASGLLLEVFGARGRHARAAVGMGSLPGNMTVEVEMTVRLRP